MCAASGATSGGQPRTVKVEVSARRTPTAGTQARRGRARGKGTTQPASWTDQRSVANLQRRKRGRDQCARPPAVKGGTDLKEKTVRSAGEAKSVLHESLRRTAAPTDRRSLDRKSGRRRSSKLRVRRGDRRTGPRKSKDQGFGARSCVYPAKRGDSVRSKGGRADRGARQAQKEAGAQKGKSRRAGRRQAAKSRQGKRQGGRRGRRERARHSRPASKAQRRKNPSGRPQQGGGAAGTAGQGAAGRRARQAGEAGEKQGGKAQGRAGRQQARQARQARTQAMRTWSGYPSAVRRGSEREKASHDWERPRGCPQRARTHSACVGPPRA